jgi:antirestriction protein ArdC/phage/plasmid primase-like uncharacterized protein
MAEQKQPYHERVAEEVIKALQEGTAPWIKPWEPGQQPDRPTNALTGKPYRGWNSVYLSMLKQGEDNRWCTYKQASELGAQVRKGEKGAVVQYWQFREKKLLKDDQGKPILDEKGEKQYRNVELERPKVFHAVVFHASQIDGMPPLPPRKERPEWERHADAEKLLEASGASIHHDQNDRAFYRPSTDKIHMPERGQFPTPDNYYATALHELGHWTGHPSRLDRDLAHPFGSEGYAKEELRAELASYMLGTELGIGHDPGQHTAYIGSWIKALKEDPQELFRASRDAQQIMDYVQGLVQEQEQEQEKVQTQQQLVAELDEASGEALEGYKSIESWRTMETAAKAYGMNATLARSEREEGAMVIRYEKDGETLPIETELMPGDGKAVTLVDGERVPGTGFTSDPEWQAEAFKQAVTPLLQHQVTQRQEQDQALAAKPWQLADDPETYGDNAGHWIVVSADGENELAGGPWPDYERAEQEAGYINRMAAGLAEVREGRMTAEGLDTVANTMIVPGEYGVQSMVKHELDTWTGTTQVRGCVEIEQDGEKFVEEAPAEEAQFFGVYVGQQDGRMMWQSDHPTQEQANAVAQRLEAIHDQAKVYQSREAQEQTVSRSQAQAKENNAMETPKQEAAQPQQIAQEKTWLNVPYKEKNEAKQQGARWDKGAKSWYAPEGTNLAPLSKWLPENNEIRQEPPQDPRAEFAEALKDAGLKVEGLPQMDGKLHRVPVEGDEKGKSSGAYKGYLDGHPAGFIQNFKSGYKENWKATGQRLNPAEIAKLEREAEAKRQAREREREAGYNAKSQAITQELASLPDAPADHPYLKGKGLDGAGHAFGAKLDDRGNLVIPIEDKEGKVWSAQRIGPNGFKGYEKDAKVSGCYQVIGGKDALAAQDAHEPLLISTGFGTSASIHMATGRPVVVAFQDNNLQDVAQEFKQMFPERTIAVLGDDDRHLPERTPPLPNSGRVKANEAAKAVGGRAVFPQFTAQEKGREFTDFSDLHRVRGLAAVQRQVEQGLAQARTTVNARDQREQMLEKKQEREKEREEQKRSKSRGEARSLGL